MIVTMFSKSDCPWCEKAKSWLAENGVVFIEERYDDVIERAAMYDRLGLVGAERTVPKIIVRRPGQQDELIKTYGDLIRSGIDWTEGFD